MARKPKTIPGPSRLSKILANLNASPRLELTNLQSLRLTLASKNDHFGARHFLKDQLPRIRWANPNLNIEVERVPKSLKESWRPELSLQFTNGTEKTLDLQDKWSTAIVRELMDAAGDKSWFRWKEEAAVTGSSLLPGEELEPEAVPSSTTRPPSLGEFRARQAQSAAAKAAATPIPPTSTPTPSPTATV